MPDAVPHRKALEIEENAMTVSRRHFVQLAGSSLLLPSGILKALPFSEEVPAPPALPGQSRVAVAHGDDRRKNVYQALLSIDDQIRPVLRQKKYVVIKPNTVTALNGILDYLEPRFHGPVIIADSSADDTLDAFENFRYYQVAKERRTQQISLVDLNRDGKYDTVQLLDFDLHPITARLAAHLVDPAAYVICAAMLKTHNTVVATMSVKNMVLGAPLRSAPGQLAWSDKRKYHLGVRQTHYNMLLTAQKLKPFWGATVLDGFEGMEGEGPTQGTPVPSRLAIASTDYVAADRVALEVMGINPDWVGYLQYCGQLGVGEYDLAKIQVIGASIASVQKKYKLHPDIDRELQWMGPMDELPFKLGSISKPSDLITG
jgi:uncharacterized protein (DUF362 family)